VGAPTLASLVGAKPGTQPAANTGKLPTLQSVLGIGGGKLPSLKDVLAGNNATVAPAKKAGGGVLGWVGKELGQTGSDLYHAAIDAPAGVYYTAKGLATDPAGTVKAYGKSLLGDLEHPLRHPGYTLLDLVGALDAGAGTAARLGAASAALGEGATAADVARALVKHPGYGTRTLRTGDLTVNPETSRSAIGAAVQQATDKLLQNAADKNPASRAADIVNRKVGKVIARNAQTAEQIAKGPGAALIKIGRNLSPAEQKALQVVAEQAPIQDRITATAARIVGAKDEVARGRHQDELDLLHQAKPLLTVENGKPAFADAGSKAAKAYGVMEKVAGDRETLLKSLGLLTDEAIQSRTTNAGRVALGASNERDYTASIQSRINSLQGILQGQHTRSAGSKLSSFNPAAIESRIQRLEALKAEPTIERAKALKLIHADSTEPDLLAALRLSEKKSIQGAQHFAPDENAIRIPDVATKGRGSRGGVIGRVGAQGTIGHLKEPGSVTHEYTGTLREQGLRREDTAQLVGESSLEAAKYAGLEHVHDLVRQVAQPAPLREDDIAVRLDHLGSHEKLPLDVRKFVDHPEDFFAHATPTEQATVLDKVRAQMFPTNFAKAKTLTGDAAAEFQRLNEQGKIGWVPKKVLGRLSEPQAPLAAVAGKTPVKVVDAINNASRFSILYLKPAYALPNVLGNAALNVLQQGWAAPVNLARAARINARLGPELAARIDSAMGEGVAQSVAGHEGLGTRVVQGAANKWGSVVDTPFRRASFLYEARQAGYKTPEQINRLLTDQGEHQHLIGIANRANSEAINYSNLSPVEREIIRRVVFFYPWIKGSTVYAGRLLREHPIKSAALGQVGVLGHEKTDQALGPIPSYLEGIFPVGKSSVVNPNSAAILQTPAQVGSALAGLATGNINQASQASGFLTPALTLALAEALRENPSTGHKYKGGTNAGVIARDVLGSQLPQVTLERNLKAALTGTGGSKLYPPSVKSALLQFLVGGAAPRKIDLNDLHRLARSEQTQMRTGR
jgi:hypothetical protein